MKRVLVGLFVALVASLITSNALAGPYNTYPRITADNYYTGDITAYPCLSGVGSSGWPLSIGDGAVNWINNRTDPIAPYGTLVIDPARLRSAAK